MLIACNCALNSLPQICQGRFGKQKVFLFLICADVVLNPRWTNSIPPKRDFQQHFQQPICRFSLNTRLYARIENTVVSFQLKLNNQGLAYICFYHQSSPNWIYNLLGFFQLILLRMMGPILSAIVACLSVFHISISTQYPTCPHWEIEVIEMEYISHTCMVNSIIPLVFEGLSQFSWESWRTVRA